MKTLIFAILGWILSRWLRGVARFAVPSTEQQEGSVRSARSGPPNPRTPERLVGCDVCGVRFPEGQAIEVVQVGRCIRVCSEQCRRQIA